MNLNLGNNSYEIGILLKKAEYEENYYEIIDFPFIRQMNEG